MDTGLADGRGARDRTEVHATRAACQPTGRHVTATAPAPTPPSGLAPDVLGGARKF